MYWLCRLFVYWESVGKFNTKQLVLNFYCGILQWGFDGRDKGFSESSPGKTHCMLPNLWIYIWIKSLCLNSILIVLSLKQLETVTSKNKGYQAEVAVVTYCSKREERNDRSKFRILLVSFPIVQNLVEGLVVYTV